jgi:serine/threonine protein kinase
MELHQEHGDLWTRLRYQNNMVGAHSSLVRTYLSELLAALEHCHRHGVVHRDLKTENLLLSERGGHVVLIDFGTAKDLVATDLNGPEFVG